MKRPLVDHAATQRLAQQLGPLLAAGDLLILDGPLGAGKTYFAGALCRTLGLDERIRVPSPTFVLMNEYETDPPLCHADLYRLSTGTEVEAVGLDAQRDDGKLVLVEWGRPYIELLGGDAVVVQLSVDPRSVELYSTGPRSQDIVSQLETEEPCPP